MPTTYGQTQIVQKPRFEQLVAGQPIIFVVENNQVVANEIRVKHNARMMYFRCTNFSLFPKVVVPIDPVPD